MRIIAGRFRRRALQAPKGRLTRPTTDRTRESLFGLIESRFDLEGADVLDLFAGTGALGLEALSRGAQAVTFVEASAGVLRYTRRNAADLGVDDMVKYIRADAVLFIDRYSGPPFDLALAGVHAARTLRGGSWRYSEHDVRCAYRRGDGPDGYGDGYGFRVIFSPPGY